MTQQTSLRLHDATVKDLREVRARLEQQRTLEQQRESTRPVTYADAIAYALSYVVTVLQREAANAGAERQL